MSDLVGIAAGSNTNDVPFILDCLYDEAQCRTDTVDWFIKQFLAYCGFPCCIETPGSNNVNRHLSPRQQRATTYNSRMRISLSFKRAFLNIDNILFIGESRRYLLLQGVDSCVGEISSLRWEIQTTWRLTTFKTLANPRMNENIVKKRTCNIMRQRSWGSKNFENFKPLRLVEYERLIPSEASLFLMAFHLVRTDYNFKSSVHLITSSV